MVTQSTPTPVISPRILEEIEKREYEFNRQVADLAFLAFAVMALTVMLYALVEAWR